MSFKGNKGNKRNERIKRINKIGLILILALLLNLPLQALSTDMPSSWAVNEIKLARYEGLLPGSLLSEFQKPITRVEFTLLAIKYIEKVNLEVSIKENPFTDILGHPHYNEILKAYSAGIIYGNPDGTFKPDNNITREEIASLMVNLIKAVYPQKNVSAENKYKYKDESSISGWALPYVKYCYEQKILQGTAELTISPKTNTSREQAGALIYRLALKNGVVKEMSKDIVSKMPIKTKQNVILGEDKISQYHSTFGEKGRIVLENLKRFVDYDSIEITENTLAYMDGSTEIIMDKTTDLLEIDILTKDISSTLTKDAVDIILEITEIKTELNELLQYWSETLELNERLDKKQLLKGKYYVVAFEYLNANKEKRHFIKISYKL